MSLRDRRTKKLDRSGKEGRDPRRRDELELISPKNRHHMEKVYNSYHEGEGPLGP